MNELDYFYKCRCSELIRNGLALEECNNYENFKDLMKQEDFKLVMSRKQNRKNKRYRTKNKILEMYKIAMILNSDSKHIVFGTITLNDYYLSLKEDTYIRKIDKSVKSHFVYAIINKDFGSKTEREHYHFIGLTTEELESKNKTSKKGFAIYELAHKDYELGFEPTLCIVDLQVCDMNKTMNYLLKLNNHSNKLGTKNRTRVLKNHTGEMACLLNLSTKKKHHKKPKINYSKSISNPTYDTLNKRSVSLSEISLDNFISYLDGSKSIKEL